MINVVIPMAGKNKFFPEDKYPFPKPLIEVGGKTIIEHVIDNLESIKESKRYIFIVNDIDCRKHHLDNVLNILTNGNCEIVKISEETKGSVCSILMTVDMINNNDELVISNSDQIIKEDLNSVIQGFRCFDGGVVTFSSIHPRWSYVRVGNQNQILEVAEKKPISKYAIAGFYYYKKGRDFVSSAMSMILKDNSIEGNYYVSPTYNEMILKNKTAVMREIDNYNYYTFYSPEKLDEYKKNRTLR